MAAITLKTVLLPPATLRAVQAVLTRHGVRMDVHEESTRQASFCVLILPAGSRQEHDGYVCGREQNKLLLPDGFVLCQTLDAEGWSSIRFLSTQASESTQGAP